MRVPCDSRHVRCALCAKNSSREVPFRFAEKSFRQSPYGGHNIFANESNLSNAIAFSSQYGLSSLMYFVVIVVAGRGGRFVFLDLEKKMVADKAVR